MAEWPAIGEGNYADERNPDLSRSWYWHHFAEGRTYTVKILDPLGQGLGTKP